MIKPLYVYTSDERATAVLSPTEWNDLRKHLNDKYRVIGDFLLHSGVRIAEGYRIVEEPELFRRKNHAIFLPAEEGSGKRTCKFRNRSVILSDKGVDAVEKFLMSGYGLPAYQSMEPVFKRAARDAGIDDTNITTKMFRKTYVSWLMSCYPEKFILIAHSAGHTLNVMLSHYIVGGWTREDIALMREELKGWGEN
jgi:integrase